MVFRDQFLHCRIGFSAAPPGVLDDRDRRETKYLMRIARRLGQRLVASALRAQVQRQMGAPTAGLRGEFQRLPIRRLRFGQAIARVERRSEVVVACGAQRVLHHRQAIERDRLVESTKTISHHAGSV